MLYFRGFGTDTCNSVSVEYPITVISGIDGSTCGGPGPSPPTPGTATAGAPTLPNAAVTCNLARGSVIDGVCVCASDWIGPPECVGTPIWKWLVTVGGGVAAMCSIAVSIRAFLMSRKAKKKSAAADPTSPKKGTAVVVEMESMRMQTPERRESTQPDDVPYIQRESGDQDPSSTGVAVPPSPRSKEYTI
ncbi:hypothetical protein H257_02678 [Aphanomyces astaci]|uniref:Uncharacterized protein n=1 Tax=Aphanomyces astaci TaxID=112090 RepID=W4H2Z2_APHAT|nr:hypothetical protein H257_02678 [Aphanomyces astaci]ETV86252.1 hypothetical protein H257_02678 [Aphanomyces astaci]|eukprot:XP_009824724.1 hypothetical protein H257_02678 [Aphanomyces astaci]